MMERSRQIFPTTTPTNGSINHQVTAQARRKSPKPRFYWQERDYDILRAVYEYRVLSTPEIEQLLFPRYTRPSGESRSNPRANARLRYLAEQGYLVRREQPHYVSEGRKPYLYMLGRKGAQRLAERNGCEPFELDWQPKHNQRSDFFYSHLLACNRVRIAATLGAYQHGLSIVRWIDDTAMRRKEMHDHVSLEVQGRTRQVAVIPDAYAHIASRTGEQQELHLLFEVDMGTETGRSSDPTRRDWITKVRSRVAYYRGTNSDLSPYVVRYQTTKLRILVVTTSWRRAQYLRELTEDAGGRTRWWFTTLSEITPETFYAAPVWTMATRPMERHALIKGRSA